VNLMAERGGVLPARPAWPRRAMRAPPIHPSFCGSTV
jgi:hypothetical protein